MCKIYISLLERASFFMLWCSSWTLRPRPLSTSHPHRVPANPSPPSTLSSHARYPDSVSHAKTFADSDRAVVAAAADVVAAVAGLRGGVGGQPWRAWTQRLL